MAGLASVGASAADGLDSGFRLGLAATAQQDARTQREFENKRQQQLDDERTSQRNRDNSRQDTQDANAADDRALAGINSQIDDHRLAGAALAAQYGGPDKIPGDQGSDYAAKANALSAQRAALLQKRYAPEVAAEQQWAKDTSSRIATGQMSMDDLSPTDTVRLIQATTRRPISDFLRPTDGSNNGNSVVGQGIADTTAGIKTNNTSLAVRGAGTLMAPDINEGIGHTAPDGSTITGKSLYALVPAPAQGMQPGQQAPVGLGAALNAAMSSASTPPPAANAQPAPTDPNAAPPAAGPAPTAPTTPAVPDPDTAGAAPMTPPPTAGSGTIAPTGPAPGAALAPANAGGNMGQIMPAAASAPAPATPPAPALTPGQDPDKLLPVLQVTAEHPDGTQVQYHAPITMNRSTDPNDPIHPGISMSDAMQKMGQMGVLESWANTPQAKAKLQAGLDALGDKQNSFLGAYYAMKGDPKALLPAGSQDPTSLKIKAIQKLADDKFDGDYAAASQAFMGKSTTGLQSKFDAIDNLDVSDSQKDALKRVAAGDKTTGLTPAKTKAAGVGGSAALPGSGTGGKPALSGQELLAAQTPADQATIKGLHDGSISPTTLSIRNNHRENMVSLAARVFDGSDGSQPMNTSTAAVNTGTERAYTGNGVPAKAIRSINVSVDHLATLKELAGALNNGSVPLINSVANKVSAQLGTAAPTNFDMAKQFVGDEVLKAAIGTGGAGAQADRDAIVAGIKNSQSPDQLNGWIDTATKFMGGQLVGLQQGYTSGGGAKDFNSTFLTPHAQAAFRAAGGQASKPRSSGLGGGGAASSKFTEGQVYQDANGNKARYQGGNWVPL
jgi:hypothetical protein